MPFDDEQILQDYIARLLAMQDERQEWLGEHDLNAVARDLGLSDEDLARLDAVIEGHRQRGKNFGRHGAWDEAISEFRQAAVLDPFDVPLLYELAVAHASRWEDAKDPEDQADAERYARRCIELDPGHQPSYELLTTLKKPLVPTPAASRQRLLISIAAAVVLIAALGVALAFFSLQNTFPPNASPTSNPAPAPNPSPPTTDAPPASEVAIPVRLLADGQALRLDVQRSLLNRYDDAFSYTLHATLHNEADELHRLRLKMTLLDADGTALQTKYFDGLADHKPYLRPGDTAPVSELIYEKQPPPDLQNVELSVDIIERETAAANYGTPTPVPLTWEFTQPAHLDVAVFERESRISDGLREPLHFLTLAVRNNGTRPVQHLRLKVTWFDAEDNVLASELTYAVASSGPAMRAGETWVARAIGTLPADDTPLYARYAVSVAEAE